MNHKALLCSFLLSCIVHFTHCKNHINRNSTNQVNQSLSDTAGFNRKMLSLSNNDPNHLWPAPVAYPLPGAILPYKRIVAFYGNLYDSHLGILGALPKNQLLQKLRQEAQLWAAADTATPVIPAFHCIAVMAWDEPDTDGKYRNRVSTRQADTLLEWAKELNGLVFLDIQVGTSTLQQELPPLKNYLAKPTVHLGIDAEFSMKNGPLHSGQVGTFDASDINYAIDYLAALVKQHRLPPKILVVHRFTAAMVTGYKKIKKLPEVQVVMDMDGFGDRAEKKESYLYYIYREPVAFAGFKLFYQQDGEKDSAGLMLPTEVLHLVPQPIYIQYQ